MDKTSWITASRRIQFAYGHRVWKHESKCKHVHGHNGVLWFHARAPKLDSLGRVIDFGVLKEKLGGFIDEFWDHGFLYNVNDTEVSAMLDMMTTQKKYALPDNPTAENMANHLLLEICPKLLEGTGVEVFKITMYETENCIAEAILED